MTLLARLISYIFNPVVLLFPAPFFLVYKTSQNSVYALEWTVFSWIFIFAVAAFVLYAVLRGIFTDFDVSKREQRPLLFLFTAIVAVLYMIGLFFLHGPKILYVAVLGILLGIFCISLINTRLKASIHLATISALITALSILYGGMYLVLLILIPLIVWARVTVKRHTIEEALVGMLAGGLLTFGLYIALVLLLHV